MSSKSISSGEDIYEWLKENNEVEQIKRAYYAYQADPKEPGAHRFYHGGRGSICQFCGRSRRQVRYLDGPIKCQKRPDWWPVGKEYIIKKIREEERNYFELLEEAKEELPKIVDDPSELSGKEIGVLQHTHGYQPSVVEGVLNFEMTEKQRKEFEDEMERHREESKS